jgi:hypothetical protein
MVNYQINYSDNNEGVMMDEEMDEEVVLCRNKNYSYNFT